MTNRELIEKYPWLTPTNRWSGKKITDCAGSNGEEGYWPDDPTKHPEYNYEFTELDDMPKGWRRAFGEEMCEELNQELLTWNEEDRKEFHITQIKEKYGELRFYVNYGSKALYDIIDKYTTLSRGICINCGKTARWISRGWISPYCDDCAREFFEHFNGSYSAQTPWEEEFIDINEYYKPYEEED